MAKRSLFNQVVLALSLLCAGALLVRFVIAPLQPSVYTDGDSILDEGTWQGSRRVVWEPADLIAGISTGDSESDASMSSDGRTLYYSAGMPGGLADLWVADLGVDGTVLDTRPLDDVNSPADERDPFVTDEGLFFSSNREGGHGGLDIYFARRQGGSFGTPLLLDVGINSGADDRAPSLDDASRMLAFSSDRAMPGTASAGSTGFDLYLAERLLDSEISAESFSDPVCLLELSSEADEIDPFLWHDGTRLVFASNRSEGQGGLDLYWSLWTGDEWLSPRPLDELNSDHDDFGPHGVDRGFSMIFSSIRPVGPGLSDLYRASSRELFPLPGERSILDIFAEGLILLLLLLALAAFLANRWSKLDIVVKCILISILAHLLIMLWFKTVEIEGVLEEPAKDDTYRFRLVTSLDDTEPSPEANRSRGDEMEMLARAEMTPDDSERVEPSVEREVDTARGVQADLVERPRDADAVAREERSVSEPVAQPERRVDRALAVAAGELASEADPRPLRSESDVAVARSASAPRGERSEHEVARPQQQRAQETPAELARRSPSATEVLRDDSERGAQPRRRSVDPSVAAVAPVAVAAAAQVFDESDPERAVAVRENAPAVPRATSQPEVAESSRISSSTLDQRIAANDRPEAPAEVRPPSSSAPSDALVAAPRRRTFDATRAQPRSARPVVPQQRALVTEAVEPAVATESESPAAVALAAPQELDMKRSRTTAQPERRIAAAPPLAARGKPKSEVRPTRSSTMLARADVLEKPQRLQRRQNTMPLARREVTRPLTEPELESPPVEQRPQRAAITAADPPRILQPRRRAETLAKRDTFEATRGAAASIADTRIARSVRPSLGRMSEHKVERRETGPAAHGLYSRRTASGKALALQEFGGTVESERAVQRGLAYLAGTQNNEGSWGRRQEDDKYGRVQVGKTGLATLAFLASGHTQFSETNYSKTVREAMDFLLRTQNRDTGHFGDTTSSYSHGIATYALAEAYAMTRDRALREPLERAVTWILVNQQLERADRALYGGWGYYYADGRRLADSWPRASVSVWQIMALKSATIGGIDVPDVHLEAARVYLMNSFDGRLGAFRYSHDPKRLATRWPTLPASTPASVFGLLLLDQDETDPRIQAGLRYTHERAPERYRPGTDDQFVLNAVGNLYFWYYGTLAMFMKGGEHWEVWNENLRDMLVGAQNEDGSWTPITHYAKYAGDVDGARDYTTAMCVLMLEVYYRYFTPLLEDG